MSATASDGAVETTEPILRAESVTVRFAGLIALNEVDVSVPPGTIVGLVGPNGAGKSTLFGVLSGLLRPNRGRVSLAGRDVTGARPQVRARLGLARTFQHPELFSGLSVRDHLVLAHRVRHARRRLWTDLLDGRAWRAADPYENQRVDGILELLGITDIARRDVSVLPLGLSRLVEVGRALATSPKVVLLDEPSSGLDASETERLSAGLVRARDARGVSFLLVEHDVAMVLGLSATVFVLDFGVLIAKGTPEEIRADPAVKAAYLGDEAIPEGAR
jgi:ABC-type branched-subunit amino acid transport system ATPase component